MPSTAGRKATVNWSADDLTYHPIQGIDTVSGGPQAAPIDDDEFGVEWNQSISGILSNPFTLSGGFRSGDTNGQIAIRTAMIGGAAPSGYLKVLWDGTTTGWKAAVNISKFDTGAKVEDKVTVSIEGKTTGAVTFLP